MIVGSWPGEQAASEISARRVARDLVWVVMVASVKVKPLYERSPVRRDAAWHSAAVNYSPS